MDGWTTAGLVALIATHLPPSVGLVGQTALRRLYADAAEGPVAVLLLRHRALSFATIVGFAVAGLVTEAWAAPALALGAVSAGGYLALWAVTPAARTAATNRVAAVDLVALAVVVPALLLR